MTTASTSAYHRLMAGAVPAGAFDRHVFACILAIGLSEAPTPLTEAVGLDRGELAELLAAYFPHCPDLADGLPENRGADSLEEPDLREMLLLNGTAGRHEERWLAAMVARRSLRPNHLWQDLGLTSRNDLSALLHTHFRRLADKNVRDMKWKKFFYRQMCEVEEVIICKSPICDQCSDFAICFGPEE